MAKDAKTTSGTQGLKKPVCFVENKGQVTDKENNPLTDIKYKLSTPGMSLYLGNGALHYQFKKVEGIEGNNPHATTYRMDVTLIGANKQAKVVASEPQSYYENYYYSQFGTEGVHANSYNKIIYKDVYPNIDWVLYVKNNKVEYDFVVHEGGNVKDIKVKYAGATALRTNNNGSLFAETPMGSIEEKAPYAYENTTGKTVAANFKLHNNTVTFATGNYNGALTIDPYLEWSTYFGGTGEDEATGVKEVTGGDVYVSGYTASTGLATGGAFLTTNAGVTYDAFLAKYNTDGVLQFATYYGGNGTNTQGTALALDNTFANVYLTGYTTSVGLSAGGTIQQASNGGLNDAFLVKFSNTGTRTWATYCGGADNDYAYSVAVDASNNVYIAGQTASTTQIASGGSYQSAISGTTDAFLVKYTSASGTRIWGTYFGGSAEEQAYGVTSDASNNIFITGQTNSIIGIATAGAYQTALNGTNDAFVAKFSSAGALDWGTYFGGPGTEQGNGVVCNTINGTVAIVGSTSSNIDIASTYAAQPAYGGGLQDAFVAYFTNAGAVSWSTYFGGPGIDYGQSICLDSFKNVVIAGATYSTSGIATAGNYQTTIGGDYDAFVSKFTRYGQKLWGTYFGGTFYDYANAVACGPMDEITIAGYTSSLAGIATAGAQQTTNDGGTYDAFISKFDRDTLVVINQPFTDTLVCAGGTLIVNYTANFSFQADNIFTVQMSNAFGSFTIPVTIGTVNATASGTISCTIPAGASGTGYRIRIVASDPAFTSPDDLYNIDVVTTQPATTASGTTPVCAGGTIYLYDTANYIVTGYSWSGPAGFTAATQNTSIAGVSTANAGTYTVTTSHNGCPDISDTVSIVVNTFIPPTPSDSVSGNCQGGTISLFANPDTSLSGITYNWSGPAGFTSTLQNPTISSASLTNQGYYYVNDTFGACPSVTNSIYVTINAVTPTSITITAIPGDTICYGSEVTFTATTTNGGLDPSYQWLAGNTPVVGALSSTFSSLDLVNGTTVSCILISNIFCPAQPYDTSNVITMTVIDNTPLSHITASPGATVAPGQTVTFSSTVFNPGTNAYYEWLVNGDTAAAGIGVDTLDLHYVSGNDTVTLIVHTTNTCTNPDSAISNTIIIQPNTSVPLVSVLNNVSLFPNPNNGTFTISGDLAGLNTNMILLEISNPLGQIVYRDNAVISNNKLSRNIDLKNLAAGIYLLHITGDGQSKVIRFSVEK